MSNNIEINIELDKKINLENELNIDNNKMKKMIFIFNALNNGWTIKKQNNNYIFSKNHENKKEIYDDNYLFNFISHNVNMSNILN